MTFRYPTRSDLPIFRSLNLTLQPGKVTAIVGPSGSGKSTIGTLLLRFYDPNDGQIKLDGTSISDLDPVWLRQSIGTVSQVSLVIKLKNHLFVRIIILKTVKLQLPVGK